MVFESDHRFSFNYYNKAQSRFNHETIRENEKKKHEIYISTPVTSLIKHIQLTGCFQYWKQLKDSTLIDFLCERNYKMNRNKN